MPLRGCIADQGVFRLQVQDVKLVDARRNHQEGALIHLVRQRLVFEQLEKLVFKDYGTFGGGDIFSDFKDTFIGHRHMTLLHVVQHVGHALGDALAFGVDGFFLGFCIEREKVAGCRSGHPLLDRETKAGLGLGVGFNRFSQAHQGVGVELVGRAQEFGNRVGLPGRIGKPAINRCRRCVAGLQALVPERRCTCDVALLKLHEFARLETNIGLSLIQGLEGGKVHLRKAGCRPCAQSSHDLLETGTQGFLHLLDRTGPFRFRIQGYFL